MTHARDDSLSAMGETKLDARWIRRNAWITALSCLPWLVALGLVIVTRSTGVWAAAIAPHIAILGAVGFAAAWRRKPYARQEPLTVRVDAHALYFGQEMIPRGLVESAELLPTPFGPVVRLTLEHRLARDLAVEDEDAAHQLMTALGYDASQRTATYRAASLAVVRYRYAPFGVVFAYLAMSLLGAALHTGWGFALMPIFLIGLLALFIKRTSVVVGVDGLLLRWLWVREFIATKDILDVRRFDQGFGRSHVRGVEVITPERAVKLPLGEDEAAMVHQRIRDVIVLARSSTHVADDAMLLARGGLPLRDWILHLKALGAGATATLRTAAVMPERLWHVASDPGQPAQVRAAAAVALSPTLDDGGRVRLADIAKATAEPRLRVALERAAFDAPEEEMEEALLGVGEG